MMKCVLVLALLHLCVSAKSDTNLITEIIHGLNITSRKVDLKSNGDVIVKTPSSKIPSPHNCLGVVIKELRNLLSKVTVQEEDKRYIRELQGNLNFLEHRNNHNDNASCIMKSEHISKITFPRYINFFKKLNTRDGKSKAVFAFTQGNF